MYVYIYPHVTIKQKGVCIKCIPPIKKGYRSNKKILYKQGVKKWQVHIVFIRKN